MSHNGQTRGHFCTYGRKFLMNHNLPELSSYDPNLSDKNYLEVKIV